MWKIPTKRKERLAQQKCSNQRAEKRTLVRENSRNEPTYQHLCPPQVLCMTRTLLECQTVSQRPEHPRVFGLRRPQPESKGVQWQYPSSDDFFLSFSEWFTQNSRASRVKDRSWSWNFDPVVIFVSKCDPNANANTSGSRLIRIWKIQNHG